MAESTASPEQCVCIPEVTVHASRDQIVVHAHCPCGYSKAVPVSDVRALRARVSTARVRMAGHDCGARAEGGCWADAEMGPFEPVGCGFGVAEVA